MAGDLEPEVCERRLGWPYGRTPLESCLTYTL